MIKEKIFRIIYDEEKVGEEVVSPKNIIRALKGEGNYHHPDIYEVQELNGLIKKEK